MNPGDDQLIQAAPPEPVGAIQLAPARDGVDHPSSVEGENPFRLPVEPPRLPSIMEATQRGCEIGGVIFWLLGMGISVYFLIVEPNRTWVDWFLRPMLFPLVLAQIGVLLGAGVGLLAGLSAWAASHSRQEEP